VQGEATNPHPHTTSEKLLDGTLGDPYLTTEKILDRTLGDPHSTAIRGSPSRSSHKLQNWRTTSLARRGQPLPPHSRPSLAPLRGTAPHQKPLLRGPLPPGPKDRECAAPWEKKPSASSPMIGIAEESMGRGLRFKR